jgi:hypothetical protein
MHFGPDKKLMAIIVISFFNCLASPTFFQDNKGIVHGKQVKQVPGIEWISLLENSKISGLGIIIFIVVSNAVSFLISRGTSKDKAQTLLVEQTVKRQDALDIRQLSMMDDLQSEIDRVKGEVEVVRKDLAEERSRFNSLSEKYATVLKENHTLQQLVAKMGNDNAELRLIIGDLHKKNEDLSDQLNEWIQKFTEKEYKTPKQDT